VILAGDQSPYWKARNFGKNGFHFFKEQFPWELFSGGNFLGIVFLKILFYFYRYKRGTIKFVIDHYDQSLKRNKN